MLMAMNDRADAAAAAGSFLCHARPRCTKPTRSADNAVCAPFDAAVLTTSLRLLRGHADLGLWNAVYAATAQSAGLDMIISTDRVFDRVDGITRIDPVVASASWPPTR